MKKIAVFCGSSLGKNPLYAPAAYDLGLLLAENKIKLIYGGARVGLMGKLANGALSAGGEVVGVLPRFLQKKEIAHSGLTKLILVESMHDRKTMMNDICEGVIALPGGYGTLEEFFEMLTWAQLGLHHKPIGILNIGGYYDHLLKLVDHMVEEGLLKPVYRSMLLVASNGKELLEKMKNYKAPQVQKWISEKTL
jgi:uncharacterized protein (TIGR00730 family)